MNGVSTIILIPYGNVGRLLTVRHSIERSKHSPSRRYLHLSEGHNRANSAAPHITQTDQGASEGLVIRRTNEPVSVISRTQPRPTHDRHRSLNNFYYTERLINGASIPGIHTDEANNHDRNLREDTSISSTLVGGSWRHDPFDAYGELNSRRVSFLLSHCK